MKNTKTTNNCITTMGIVLEYAGKQSIRVQLTDIKMDNPPIINAHICGTMKRRPINIAVGDSVQLKICLDNKHEGIIIKRFASSKALPQAPYTPTKKY